MKRTQHDRPDGSPNGPLDDVELVREELDGVVERIASTRDRALLDLEQLQREVYRAVTTVRSVLAEHPIDDRGRCTRCRRRSARRACPLRIVRGTYAQGWMVTGSLTPHAAPTPLDVSLDVTDQRRWLDWGPPVGPATEDDDIDSDLKEPLP